jgi:hypothetical protein
MKAFPTPSNQIEQGMDMRDYFASDAMRAFLTHERVMVGLHKDDVIKNLTRSAYRMADEMMEARKK